MTGLQFAIFSYSWIMLHDLFTMNGGVQVISITTCSAKCGGQQ